MSAPPVNPGITDAGAGGSGPSTLDQVGGAAVAAQTALAIKNLKLNTELAYLQSATDIAKKIRG